MDNPSNSKRKYKTEKPNIYKKIESPNQKRIEPKNSGYTIPNNAGKNNPKSMKNQSMTKTGLKSGSGQKYGNLQSNQTNMQNNSSNSLQKQHGYMSICLIFCNDKKQHCAISTSSADSFIPKYLLKFMANNQNMEPLYERGRKKLRLKFEAIENEGTKIPAEFCFAISSRIKYPILGADFMQSPIFLNLQKNSMVLQIGEKTCQVPIYLSTAANEWKPKENVYFKEKNEENVPTIKVVCMV